MSKKNEPIHDYLRRRLAEFVGQHYRMSKETGVPQSTISRIHLNEVSPRLSAVQPMLDWIHKQDLAKARARKRSAARPGGAGNRVLVHRRAARSAPSALRQ